jgi:hypothetical protein
LVVGHQVRPGFRAGGRAGVLPGGCLVIWLLYGFVVGLSAGLCIALAACLEGAS